MAKRPLPSAHDVARLAGVSQAAVSRAFTPGASISAATKEKVLRAAESLGYRPNLLARSLIKGESGIVGVVIGSAFNPFLTAALDSLSAHLARAGKHMLIFTAQEGVHADAQVEDLLKYRVDALLLMAVDLSPPMAERCRKEKISVTFFNRQVQRKSGFTSVLGNNNAGAQAIAEHLLQQGYRHFALIAGLEESSTSREREKGFTDYLIDKGFSPPKREIGYFRHEGAAVATRRLLEKKSRPDAIFCANDYMAFAAIEVARYEFGLEIGPDIGIAGFDDVEQAAWPSFDLTTYTCPVEAMIEEVLQILLNIDAKRPATKIVSGVIKQRGSTQRRPIKSD